MEYMVAYENMQEIIIFKIIKLYNNYNKLYFIYLYNINYNKHKIIIIIKINKFEKQGKIWLEWGEEPRGKDHPGHETYTTINTGIPICV